MKGYQRAVLLIGVMLLVGGRVLAANYTLPSPTFSPCRGGANNWSAATNTCSDQISFSSGDTVTSSSPQTLTASGGFALRGNTIGSASNPITLQSSYNQIATVSPHAATTIYGSVKNESAAIVLTNVTVNGLIETRSGAVTLTTSSVSGSVTGTGTGSLTGTNIGGDVRFNNGLTVNGGTLSGTASTNLNASFTNATVIGAVTATNGVTASNTNFSGTITATNGTSSFTGGTINADINGDCCKITISGAYVTGNISSNNELEINNSSITGTISNNNAIKFSNSTVYGNVTAAGWSTITGTGNSKVYGACSPNTTSPTTLCDSAPISTCFTDNFDRTSLGSSDWAVSSRNGSFGVPKTVGRRLRMTDNTGNVATAATLQRLLPATGNFVQVQFKYYAYNGNGADGMAVIFSDASITPQPGGYGGSLGYAQLNGTSGFAGGWAAIALDEYGNFSNPTETRIGGPGLRQDSVSVRGSGSGTTNYRYAAGTSANLSPGIDVSGSTPGPGHTYRITLDSRVSGKTMVMVERNTGSGFTTLISSFDIRTTTNQAALPSDFFLSLTGSTGGSNNIHELDDLQVCATRINSVGAQIDHYELSHASNALTCTPLPVTVKACLDSAVPCTTPYTGTNPPLSASLSPAGWSGLNFAGGVASAQLAVRTPGTVRMNVSSSAPPLKALGQTWCKSGANAWGTGTACDVAFADSGFIFDVPTLLARKPQSNISLQAVRKNPTTQSCDPAFSSGTRDILFTRSYTDPNTGTADVLVNDVVLGAAGSTVSLNFGSNATTQLKVQYNDAGQITLNARYAPSSGAESGLVMTGSDLFVSKPYGLLLQTDAISSCTADISCPLYPGGVRAGDPFSLRLKAVAWQSDGEALTAAALADNPATPNFRLNNIALSSQVQAPSGGSNGTLGLTSYSHALGNQTTLSSQSISDVGVFALTATPVPGSYFGETVSGGTSGLVGRFAPDYFDVQISQYEAEECVPGGGTPALFVYAGLNDALPTLVKAGQPFLFSGSVTALNAVGAETRNYDKALGFSRLEGGSVSIDDYVGAPPAPLTPAADGVALISNTLSFDHAVSAITVSGEPTYQFNAPRAAYMVSLIAGVTDADLVTGSSVQTAALDFRLGQARIANAHGSELQDLFLPFTAAYFNGSGYVANQLDNCTVFKPASLAPYQRTGPGSGTPALVSEPYQATVGTGSYHLSAPGENSSGSALLTYDATPGWLKFDWDGDGALDNASGLATFGIYKGAAPLIFRREIYGQ